MTEKIKLTFLGTSSAVPTSRRNHTAILLQYKSEMILIDCGEGTQRQFRKAKINMCKLTKILISHWHGDHVLGLCGLLKTMIMNGYNKELEIYGPKGTKRKIREYLDMFLIKPKDLNLKVYEVEKGIFFDNEKFILDSLPMDHGIVTNAYSFIVKEKKRLDKKKLKKLGIPNSSLIGELVKGKVVKIKGRKIDGKKLIYKEKEKKITFVIDSRYNDNAVKLSNKSDLLICEASFSKNEEDLAKHHGHMTSKEASTIAKKAKAKKLALIHLSQRYDANPKLILKEAKETFKEVFIPEDLDRIEL
tara:strand:+ start:107 stop:1015 length:909 start_codon:yes stop_codon:yes gene_type:complete